MNPLNPEIVQWVKEKGFLQALNEFNLAHNLLLECSWKGTIAEFDFERGVPFEVVSKQFEKLGEVK